MLFVICTQAAGSCKSQPADRKYTFFAQTAVKNRTQTESICFLLCKRLNTKKDNDYNMESLSFVFCAVTLCPALCIGVSFLSCNGFVLFIRRRFSLVLQRFFPLHTPVFLAYLAMILPCFCTPANKILKNPASFFGAPCQHTRLLLRRRHISSFACTDKPYQARCQLPQRLSAIRQKIFSLRFTRAGNKQPRRMCA